MGDTADDAASEVQEWKITWLHRKNGSCMFVFLFCKFKHFKLSYKVRFTHGVFIHFPLWSSFFWGRNSLYCPGFSSNRASAKTLARTMQLWTWMNFIEKENSLMVFWKKAAAKALPINLSHCPPTIHQASLTSKPVTTQGDGGRSLSIFFLFIFLCWALNPGHCKAREVFHRCYISKVSLL